jgi:hypothetical protein
VVGQPFPLPRTSSPLEAGDRPTPNRANGCDESDDDPECARVEHAKNPCDHQRRPRIEERDQRARDRALRRQLKPSDCLSNGRATCRNAVGRRSPCEAIVEIAVVPIEDAPPVPGHPGIVLESTSWLLCRRQSPGPACLLRETSLPVMRGHGGTTGFPVLLGGLLVELGRLVVGAGARHERRLDALRDRFLGDRALDDVLP